MGPVALISLIFGALVLTPLVAGNDTASAEDQDEDGPITPVAGDDPVEGDAPLDAGPVADEMADQGDTPREDHPAEDIPDDEDPGFEIPMDAAPVNDGADQEAPQQGDPVDDIPDDEDPFEDDPVEDAPVEGDPSDDDPVNDVPDDEHPIDLDPAEETPDEEAPDDEAPVIPLPTIRTDGGETTTADVTNGGYGDREQIIGTDGNDVIITDTASNEFVSVIPEGGDDTVILGLGQSAVTATLVSADTEGLLIEPERDETQVLDDQGADVVIVEVDADMIKEHREVYEQEGRWTTSPAFMELGPLDSLRINIPEDVEGQLVRIDSWIESLPGPSCCSSQVNGYSYFLLVPASLDLVAYQQELFETGIVDSPEFSYGRNDLYDNHGAIGIATVYSGEDYSYEYFNDLGPTGEESRWDSTFLLKNVDSNRAITLIEG